jgi:hypothetical protein
VARVVLVGCGKAKAETARARAKARAVRAHAAAKRARMVVLEGAELELYACPGDAVGERFYRSFGFFAEGEREAA